MKKTRNIGLAALIATSSAGGVYQMVKALMPDEVTTQQTSRALALEKYTESAKRYFKDYSHRFTLADMTGVVGLNPSPHWTIADDTSVVAETSSYLLQEALNHENPWFAWEIFLGIENFQAMRVGALQGVHNLPSAGLFISDLTIDGNGPVRVGQRAKDMNSATDADIKIVRGYCELLEKLRSGSFDISKVQDTYDQAQAIALVRAAIHEHLRAITEKDILVHKYRDKKLHALTVFGNDTSREYNPSYADWVAMDSFVKFSRAEAVGLAAGYSFPVLEKKGGVNSVDRNAVIASIYTLLGPITDAGMRESLRTLLDTTRYTTVPGDAVSFEDIYHVHERASFFASLSAKLNEENYTQLMALHEVLALTDQAAFWENTLKDTLDITKVLICEKIALRIDQRIASKEVPDTDALRALQKDLRTVKPGSIVPVFWDQYMGMRKKAQKNGKDQADPVAALLRDAGIFEIGVMKVQLSFRNGDLKIMKNSDDTPFCEGSEGPRMIIDLAEWASRSGDQDWGICCGLIAELARKRDFSVKEANRTFFDENELAYLEATRYAKSADTYFTRHNSIVLFSRMAAAAASGNKELIASYKTVLNSWLQANPEFLNEKNNYYERSLFNFAIRVLYREETAAAATVDMSGLKVGSKSDFQFDVVPFASVSGPIQNIPAANRKLHVDQEFPRPDSDMAKEQRSRENIGGNQGKAMDNTNAAEVETGGGNDINWGLSRGISAVSQQMYVRQAGYSENERAVNTLKRALEQYGIKGPGLIEVWKDLKAGKYEADLYVGELRRIMRATADRRDIAAAFSEFIDVRSGLLIGGELGEAFNSDTDKKRKQRLKAQMNELLTAKNASGAYRFDPVTVLQRMENILRAEFSAENNIALRLALVDALIAGGERYVAEANREVMDLFDVFTRTYKDAGAKEFASSYELYYRENMFMRILERYYTLSYEDFMETDPAKTIDSNCALFAAILAKVGIQDPALVGTAGPGSPLLFRFSEQALSGPLALEHQRILNAVPRGLNDRYFRYRIYDTATMLMEKNMELHGDYDRLSDVKKLNALTIKELNGSVQAKGESGQIISLSGVGLESPDRINDLGSNLLNRIIYLNLKKAQHLFAQLSSAQLNDPNDPQRKLAKEQIEQVQGLMQKIIAISDSPAHILKMVKTQTEGVWAKDQYTDEEQMYMSISFMTDLTRRGIAAKEFDMMWQFNYAMLNFMLADVTPGDSSNFKEKAGYYAESLYYLQKVTLAAEKITGSVLPSIILDNSPFLEIILKMKLVGFANITGNTELGKKLYEQALVLGELITFSKSKLSSAGFTDVRVSGTLDQGQVVKSVPELDLTITNALRRQDIVIQSHTPKGLMFSIERDMVGRSKEVNLPYLNTASEKRTYDGSAVMPGYEITGDFAHRVYYSLILPGGESVKSMEVRESGSWWYKRFFGDANPSVRIVLTFKSGKSVEVKLQNKHLKGEESHTILFDKDLDFKVDAEIEKTIQEGDLPSIKKLDVSKLSSVQQMLKFFTRQDISSSYRLARTTSRELPDDPRVTATAQTWMDRNGLYGKRIKFVSELDLWTEVKDYSKDVDQAELFTRNIALLNDALEKAPGDPEIALQMAKMYGIVGMAFKNKSYYEQSKGYADDSRTIFEEELIKPSLQKKDPSVRYLKDAERHIDYVMTLLMDSGKLELAKQELLTLAKFFVGKSQRGTFIADPQARALFLRWTYAFGKFAQMSNNAEYARIASRMISVVLNEKRAEASGYGSGDVWTLLNMLESNEHMASLVRGHENVQNAYYDRSLNEFKVLQSGLRSPR